MKKKLLFILSIFIGALTYAQSAPILDNPVEINKDTLWKINGFASLTGAQSYFSNWTAGGDNSLAFNGLFNIDANYLKDKISWDNKFTTALGYQKIGDKSIAWRKTDDRLEFSSQFGYKAAEKLKYSALLDFKTQMFDGFEYADTVATRISSGFAPAYLIFSAGIQYIPFEGLSVYLSPVTGKSTIVADKELSDKALFGVDTGKVVRNELGGYFKLGYKTEVLKNVSLDTELALFSNYLENPQNVDINWDVNINMKINKYLSATLSTSLIYDDDIDIKLNEEGKQTGIQFKEIFGLGISYKF